MRLLFIFLTAFTLAHGAEGSTASSCVNVFDRVVSPYKKLFMKLPKTMMLDAKRDVVKMVTLKNDLCASRNHRQAVLRIIVNALSEHSSRIGVLLPLSGPKGIEGNAIAEGMKAALGGAQGGFQHRMLMRDTRGIAAGLEQSLSELVFKQNVSLLIGGFTRAEATALEWWGNKLRIPTIILNKKTKEKVLRHVFHIFPEEINLSDKLVAYAKQMGLKRVALLHPLKVKGRKLSPMFSEKAAQLGIEVEHDYVYNSSDYLSMQAAAKKIFKIDPVIRSEEYKRLVDDAKEKAKEAGVPFNPSLVALSPIVEVDAIFIDDNFRTVRHFSKIFEFLGVEKIKLLGTPQWRAQGLVSPPMAALDGAVFVDYMGDYRHLPPGIKVPMVQSSYFVDPEFSTKVDYMVIGHHAADTAGRVVSHSGVKRRLIYALLEKAQVEPGNYFPKGPVFTKQHISRWPTFLFKVGADNISPLRQPRYSGRMRDTYKKKILPKPN